MQDILLTNHGAHKELNNHNIYNKHNWIDLNTHNMKTIDRINIHKKQKNVNVHYHRTCGTIGSDYMYIYVSNLGLSLLT